MKSFFHVQDIGDLSKALEEAKQVKATPFAWQHLGKNKTIILVFFNSSLHTRLSSQKAALNLGLDPIVLNVNGDSWKLETRMGVVMDGDKSEHLREAIPVIGSYCDLIGVRSFAGLTDKEFDYNETILKQFIDYSGKPVISLESATVHPCQAFADLFTIEEYKTKKRPKVVMTW
ncbi:MAG: acetylornithine carbamoyltransferase, partial [Bacteroidales bacterium]|nr:acetylornithine carbamoyltransferase [Bacteroidales bacterium]